MPVISRTCRIDSACIGDDAKGSDNSVLLHQGCDDEGKLMYEQNDTINARPAFGLENQTAGL
jgi:hypothetical protein